MFYDAFSQDMALGHLPYPLFIPAQPITRLVRIPSIRQASPNRCSEMRRSLDETACNFECDTFSLNATSNAVHGEITTSTVQQQINSHTMVQLSMSARKATGCGDSST